jgi:hypothetical protein
MTENSKQPAKPACELSHDLLNELMIVIGQCDLLCEELPGDRYLIRLLVIREAAVRMSQRVAARQILISQSTH